MPNKIYYQKNRNKCIASSIKYYHKHKEQILKKLREGRPAKPRLKLTDEERKARRKEQLRKAGLKFYYKHREYLLTLKKQEKQKKQKKQTEIINFLKERYKYLVESGRIKE